MKELRVGMYVRNERGIAKYLGIGKDVLTNNKSNQFKHYAMQHLFDEPIFDVGHDWGDTLSEEEFKNIDRYIIGEPSKNIIDLIEENDLLSIEYYSPRYEERVTRLFEVDFKYDKYISLTNSHCTFNLTNEEYSELDKKLNPIIKSVVTKEQFDSVRYEVE